MFNDIHRAGVFSYGAEHDQKKHLMYVDLSQPSSTLNITKEDKDHLEFTYLGRCGGGITIGSLWIIIPVFALPVPHFNKCEKEGFIVSSISYLDEKGFRVELKYNGQVYDPYFDTSEIHIQGKKFRNDWVKFKIPDFSEFKNAQDKTLIIHKQKPDGTIFTKELPFDWKIVVETSGGL